MILCFSLGLENSVIVRNNRNHLTSLSNWLKPVAKSVNSLWKRCWRAFGHLAPRVTVNGPFYISVRDNFGKNNECTCVY